MVTREIEIGSVPGEKVDPDVIAYGAYAELGLPVIDRISILVNGFPETSTGIARALQDEIASELVRALGY